MKSIEGLFKGRQWAVLTGDCLREMGKLPDRSIDHVITDPPYSKYVHAVNRRVLRGSGGHISSARSAGGKKYGAGAVQEVAIGFDGLAEETRAVAAAAFARLCRRWCLVFADGESSHLWRGALEAEKMRHIRKGYWWKLRAQPQLSGDRPAAAVEEIEMAQQLARGGNIIGVREIEIAHPKARTRWNGGGHNAVYPVSIEPGATVSVYAHAVATDNNQQGTRFHTTQKPLALMLDLVNDFTDGPRFGWCGGVIRDGDVVLDPFMGSGTTGVACLRLGRRFVGIEQNAEYAAIARERLAAEERGLAVMAARSGQTSIFDVIPKPARC